MQLWHFGNRHVANGPFSNLATRESGGPNKMDTGSEGYRMSEDELREILQAIVDFQRQTSATLAGLIELLFEPEFGSILKCDKAEFTKRLADMTQLVIADEQLEELSSQ